MPSILSHPAPALCIGLACGRDIVPARLLMAGIFCSILPDFDVVGFKLGISYANILGHRGLSHSLLFALVIGILGVLTAPWMRAKRLAAFVVCGGAVATHIALDALTNGGLGVAVFWPFSEARYFFPWQPIEVSPFSPRQFLSQRGFNIFMSEGLWVWLPSLGTMGIIFWLRRVFRPACAGNPRLRGGKL